MKSNIKEIIKFYKSLEGTYLVDDYIEKELGLHTYSNGAMSNCFCRVEPSRWSINDSNRGKPTEYYSNHLIIGTDKNRTYLRFQNLFFSCPSDREHKIGTAWKYDPDYLVKQVSTHWSPSTISKILKSIKQMGFK